MGNEGPAAGRRERRERKDRVKSASAASRRSARGRGEDAAAPGTRPAIAGGGGVEWCVMRGLDRKEYGTRGPLGKTSRFGLFTF